MLNQLGVVLKVVAGLALAGGFFTVGCSSEGPPVGEVKTTISGSAYLTSPMADARLEAWAFQDGEKGTKWAEADADQDGAWTLELGSKFGDVLVEASSPDGKVAVAIGGLAANAKLTGVVINPVTSLSASYASYQLRMGRFSDLEAAVARADELLFEHFGNVAPETAPVSPSTDQNNLNEGIILGILLSALETRASEMSQSATVNDLLEKLEEDLAEDGYFDGQGRGQLLLGTSELSGDTLRPEFGGSIAHFLDGPDNGTHFRAAHFQDIIAFVNTTESDLFRGPPSPPDTNPPVLTIETPSNGAVVAGAVQVRATATDTEGNLDRIEVVEPASLTGTYQDGVFEGLLDTTALPDGALAITLAARDRAGNRDQRTIQVTVENEGTIAGFVFKGFVAEADVTAYQWNPGGTSPVLAHATTALDGSYALEMAGYTGPVLLVATSGSYTEEALGIEVDLARSDYLSTVVPDYSPAFRGNVTLSPQTTWAAELAAWMVAERGLEPAEAASQANAEVSHLFAELDLLGTVPVDLLAGQSCSSITDRVRYALYNAGLSQLAQRISLDSGLTPGAVVNAISLSSALALDIGSDGIFNGRDGPEQLQQGVYNLSGLTLRAELARSVIEWLNSPMNPCAVTGSDFFELADTLSEFTSDYVDGPGVSWDTQIPTIVLLSPENGAQVHGQFIVSAEASDWSGVSRFWASAPANLVDTEPRIEFFTATLDTADFTDVIQVFLEAEDRVGNRASVEFQFFVDNFGPELVFEPESGGFTNQMTFGFGGTCLDPAGVSSFTINGIPALVGEGGAFASQALNLVDGPNAFPVVAQDSLGNSTEVDYSVFLDRVQPTIFVLRPEAGQTFVYGQAIDIFASATDTNGVRTVTTSAAGVLLEDTDPAPESAAATVRAEDYPEGQLELSFVAEDLAGNVATRNVLVNILESIEFTGLVVKGPVSGARIVAKDWSLGQPSTVISRQDALTDGAGEFIIEVGPHDGLVAFEQTEGQYQEEAREEYDLPVAIPVGTFRMGSLAADGQPVTITPFTTLATALAEDLVELGGLPNDAKGLAWGRIENIFGISLNTVPLNCREQVATGFDDRARAGLLLAGLSWLGSQYYGNFNAAELLVKVFEDFLSDGLLDGKGFGGLQLSLGQYGLDANVLRATLCRGVISFMDSPYNATGLVSSNPDILAWLDEIAASIDPIFDPNQAPMPIDLSAPVIECTSHSEGQPVRGAFQVVVTSTDNDVVSSFEITQPAGLTYTRDVVSNSVQRITINLTSTAYSDGNFSVTFSSRDRSNNASSRTLSLLFDNTAPSVTWTEPAAGVHTPSRTVALAGSFVEAGSGLESLTINAVTATISGGNWSLTINHPTDGEKVYSLTATDRAGNTTVLSRTIYVDTVPPTVSLSPQSWQTDRKFYQVISGAPPAAITINDALFTGNTPVFEKIKEKLAYASPPDIVANNLPLLAILSADGAGPVTSQVTVSYRYKLNAGSFGSWVSLASAGGNIYNLPISTAISAQLGTCSPTDTHTIEVRSVDVAGNTFSKSYAFKLSLIPSPLQVSLDANYNTEGSDLRSLWMTYLEICVATGDGLFCYVDPWDALFDGTSYPDGLRIAHFVLTTPAGSGTTLLEVPSSLTTASATLSVTTGTRRVARSIEVFPQGSANYSTCVDRQCSGTDLMTTSWECVSEASTFTAADVDNSKPALSTLLDMRLTQAAGTKINPVGGFYSLSAGQTYHLYVAVTQPGPANHVSSLSTYDAWPYYFSYRGSALTTPYSYYKHRVVNSGGTNECWKEFYHQANGWEKGLKVFYDPPSFIFRMKRGDTTGADTVDATFGGLNPLVNLTRVNPYRVVGRVDNSWASGVR